MEERIVRTRRPVNLRLTLGPLCHGGGRDPSIRMGSDGVWRASETPLGPATLHLRCVAPTSVAAEAWGPGAPAALDSVADLIGADDDPPSLAGIHPLVTRLERQLPGLRIGRTGAVLDELVPTVLEQRVIGAEAAFAYRALTRACGRNAPAGTGPPLLLPADARWLATAPYWAFHRWGVEQRRAATIKAAAAKAWPLHGAPPLPVDEARRRMFAISGVGPWTVNTVAISALGDADAVPVGDYWLKHVVTHALTGVPRGTDERMLELLEPWKGQRGRVCRMLMHGAPRLPRFGPRLPLRRIAVH